jgi:hypothetical protein
MSASPLTTYGAPARCAHVPTCSASRATLACVALIVVLALLSCLPSPALAAGETAWVDTWNTSPAGVVYEAQTAAGGGGTYVAASVRRPTGSVDIVVLRYSASGDLLWRRFYDGAAHRFDWMNGLAVDRGGAVIVVGSTFRRAGDEDWLVVKFARDGRRRWVRTLSGAPGGDDIARAVAVDTRGDVVVVGSVTREATGDDWCVVKYGPGGARRWRTTMTGSVLGADEALAVAVDPVSRSIYVAGRMYGSGGGDDAVTARYRPDGRRVWRQRFDDAAHGQGRAVAVAVGATSVAVAGVSTSRAAGTDDGLLLAYAKGGAPKWHELIDGGLGATDRLTAVGIDSDGNVVAGGGLTTSPARGQDLSVVRYRPGGARDGIWQMPGPGADESAFSLCVSRSGAAYAAGVTSGDSSRDAVLVGLASDLVPFWPAIVVDRAGRDDAARSVALAEGAVYVTGVSGRDLFVMKVLR